MRDREATEAEVERYCYRRNLALVSREFIDDLKMSHGDIDYFLKNYRFIKMQLDAVAMFDRGIKQRFEDIKEQVMALTLRSLVTPEENEDAEIINIVVGTFSDKVLEIIDSNMD